MEVPFYRGTGWQRARGFGALAQVIGGTAVLFLRKYIVPAATRMDVDLFQFSVPEVAEVLGGGKKFKTAAKCGEANYEKKFR